MTKENIVKLYSLLKDKITNEDGEINYETMKRIRRLSNKDIDTIDRSCYPYEMFLLLSSEHYYLYCDDIKAKIIDIFNHTFESEKIDCIVDLSNLLSQFADNYICTEDPNDIPEIISLVIDNIKPEYFEKTIDMITLLMLRHDMYTANVKEIIKILATAKRQNHIPHVTLYVKQAATEFIEFDETYEIIKSIIGAKGLIQASLASRIAWLKLRKSVRNNSFIDYDEIKRVNKYVSLVALEPNPRKASAIGDVIMLSKSPYSEEEEYEYASIIKNAKWYRQAEAASRILRNEKIKNLHWPEEVMRKLITVVSKAKFDYQSDIISDTVCSEFYFGKICQRDFIKLNPNDIAELVSIFSNCQGLEQLRTAVQLLDVNAAIRNKDFLEIARIISSAKTENRAQYALDLASNPIILYSKFLVDLTKSASECAKGKKVKITENDLLEIIESAKEGLVIDDVPNVKAHIEKLFSLLFVSGYFWDIFEDNPEEAMYLLNSQVEDPTLNIPDDFKVRLRKLTREDY